MTLLLRGHHVPQGAFTRSEWYQVFSCCVGLWGDVAEKVAQFSFLQGFLGIIQALWDYRCVKQLFLNAAWSTKNADEELNLKRFN